MCYVVNVNAFFCIVRNVQLGGNRSKKQSWFWGRFFLGGGGIVIKYLTIYNLVEDLESVNLRLKKKMSVIGEPIKFVGVTRAMAL